MTMSKTVWAQAGALTTHNANQTCAERRLLQMWRDEARRHQVASHDVTHWIRRKMGSKITVWRTLSDGRLACAAPCNLCRIAIETFMFKVQCSMNHDCWFKGRMDDDDAPPLKCVYSQRRRV